MSFDETRKYIHDLANSFSVIDASLVRVITLMSRNNPQLADEIQRLCKADEHVKKSIHTLKQLREHVHAEANAGKAE
jgi:superfamily I DNA and RNA helicase